MNITTISMKSRTWNLAALSVAIIIILSQLFSILIPLIPLTLVAPAGFAVSIGFIIIELTLVWWLMSRSKLWSAAGAWPLLAVASGGFIALLFNSVSADAIGNTVARLGWEQAGSSFAGGWPEETGKGAAVILMLLLLPQVWNKPWHGLQLGMLAGLGFELYENLEYGLLGAFEHGSSDTLGALSSWLYRNAIGGGLHIMFSAMVGMGIGLALLHPTLSTARRWLVGLSGFLAGFGAHFVWNYEWPDSVSTVVAIVTYGFCLFGTIWCWVFSYKLANSWAQSSG